MTQDLFRATLIAFGYPVDACTIESTGRGQPGTVAEWDFASHVATPADGRTAPVRYLNPRLHRAPDAGWSAKLLGDWTTGTKRLDVLMACVGDG